MYFFLNFVLTFLTIVVFFNFFLDFVLTLLTIFIFTKIDPQINFFQKSLQPPKR